MHRITVAIATLLLSSLTYADITVPMNLINEKGTAKSIGTVTISETPYGLVFTPNLSDLPAGVHGFHIHENASCAPGEKDGKMAAGVAAGGHYDPQGTKHHGDAWGDGHLGDLPGLVVGQDGKATYAVLAPRLKMSDMKAHALMIHVGGDNHNDQPQPLGGGGARLACGVIN